MNALQTFEVHPGSEPRATVIVLHGLGADGTDFLSFADEMKLAAVGPVRWVFPRAPERPVTINGGHRMRAWYDILGADLVKREDEAGVRESFEQVHALIDREVARGMPAQRIVLAGFSQGCAITLGAGLRASIAAVQALMHREVERGVPAQRIVLAGFSQGSAIALGAGLRHDQRLAGLAGLSGYVPLADTTAAERHAANAATPVFLAHGINDGMVPMARGSAGRDLLLGLGQPVQWQQYPMEHSVCVEEVRALQQWLLQVLA